MSSWGKKRSRDKFNNNRIRLVIAIIFLFGAITIYKMYIIQIVKYDLYSALALEQHQVINEIEPTRGKILLDDTGVNPNSDLFPIVTNKVFALVYAVPKELDKNKVGEIAENIYKIFHEENEKKEVEEYFEDQDSDKINSELKLLSYFLEEELNIKKGELLARLEILKNDNFFMEIRQGKIDEELEKRKIDIIETLLFKFNKQDDPYEPIAEKVDDETLEKLMKFKYKGIDYIKKKYRYYPEEKIFSHITGFFGHTGGSQKGLYGLEGFFNEELSGEVGVIRAERDATGRVSIVNDMEYDRAINGTDLILTVDRSIQYSVCTMLEKSVESHGADGGSIIVVEPYTGAIIAMCSYPNYNANRYFEEEEISVFNNPAIFNQYEPGSVFKTITMAAGLEEKKISTETIFNDKGFVMIEGWDKPIRNSDFATHGAHGWVDMNMVLQESLNTGIIFVKNKIGDDKFIDYVKMFGFGDKTGIELETEARGNISNLLRNYVRPIDSAVASFGQGISVTPLQMVMSYVAIANGGILMKPYVVKEMRGVDGEVMITQPKQIRRVVSEKTAILLGGIMTNVIEKGHAVRAAVDGYYVAGKTGTAQVPEKEKRGYSDRTIHTFVGFAPVEVPRFVILVKIDDPKDVIYAASSAAPLFGDIADYLLKYWQVPKERKK